MDNSELNIDQIIKEKLEQYQPQPPAHVWAGVEQGLAADKAPFFIFRFWKPIAAAAVLGIIALAGWFVLPVNNQNQFSNFDTTEEGTSVGTTATYSSESDQNNQQNNSTENEENEALQEDNPNTNKTNKIDTENISPASADHKYTNKKVQKPPQMQRPAEGVQVVFLENRTMSLLVSSDTWNTYSEGENGSVVYIADRRTAPVDLLEIDGKEEVAGFKNYWNIGLYFTPEMMLNNIDSITLLNTYSLNIEPSWYFNKHWFMRFGAGISYVRDRGFAKVDFVSSDYMGSYDSVVNVTFVEVDNELYPVYHTKEVEIWDSIRHLAISEVTNSYYYLQLPLMFGYHNSTNKFKWYFYGGPAMNISIREQIEDPKANIEYIEIIDVQSRLPHRVDYSWQLWLGAGIDFRVGQKLSLALEPNYRYYFEPTFKENNYKTALSGLGLRFGLVYKLDRK